MPVKFYILVILIPAMSVKLYFVQYKFKNNLFNNFIACHMIFVLTDDSKQKQTNKSLGGVSIILLTTLFHCCWLTPFCFMLFNGSCMHCYFVISKYSCLCVNEKDLSVVTITAHLGNICQISWAFTPIVTRDVMWLDIEIYK